MEKRTQMARPEEQVTDESVVMSLADAGDLVYLTGLGDYQVIGGSKVFIQIVNL
ncbi:hypothetical protein [Planococcus lenghuensis]|uniref:hypothetical protein n=1 Tax=Planococcus lenghuensis TaxID=2213202 RepID=UPI0018DC43BD|nr:hypothetical protein [Planococcus lenghuensis]